MKIFKHFFSKNFETFAAPKLHCHRGYWVEGLQQNSLASIKKAYELGYEISEFDIRITTDKEVILFHDHVIGSAEIANLTLAEINKIQKVDSFESVLQWFSTIPKASYFLNIEIKSKLVRDRTLEKKVLELILKYKVEDRVLISSFNPLSLFYFRRNCSKILRALLLTYTDEPSNNSILKSQVLNTLALPHFLHLDEVHWSRDRFKSFLEFGIPIVLWTCNDLEKVKKYFQEGIYGIISDTLKPEQVLEIKKGEY